tara:strand:- start:216 stop:1448 length:1233 start_codon:yes stop_codon:yes gene_type:complete
MKNKFLYATLSGRELLHMLGSGAIYSDDLTGIDLHEEKKTVSCKQRDSDIYLDSIQVLVEISQKFLDHLKDEMFRKTSSHYTVPIIPIYFINELIFKSEEDREHIINMNFDNLDFEIINSSIEPSLFTETISFDFNNTQELTASSIEFFTFKVTNKVAIDSMAGAVRSLLLYAEDEIFKKSDQNKKILEYIIAILNLQSSLNSLGDYLGQNLLNFLKEDKYLPSFSVDQMIFFSVVSNFSSTNNQERILNYDLVFESLSFIPKNRINAEQKIELDTFINYLKDISEGIKSFKDEQLNDISNDNFCQKALLILLRHNSIKKLQAYHRFSYMKVNPDFPILAFFLMGLFLGYEAMSNELKGDKEQQNNFSQLFLALMNNSEPTQIVENGSKVFLALAECRLSKKIDVSETAV